MRLQPKGAVEQLTSVPCGETAALGFGGMTDDAVPDGFDPLSYECIDLWGVNHAIPCSLARISS
jgi:hypothetical protein